MYKIDYFIGYYQTQQATNKQNIRKQKKWLNKQNQSTRLLTS
jgi:hypothetical protein